MAAAKLAPSPSKFHRVWIKVRRANGARAWRGGWARNASAPTVPSWRVRVKADMAWAVKNAASIHYQQVRPFAVDAIRYQRLPITTDCSGSTTMLYRAAGRPDPNGTDYNGQGYTGTLRAHTPTVNLADAHTGDFIVYGPGNGAHVVVIDTPHATNPVVFSHGQEAAPWFIAHSQEVTAHGGYFTVHNGDALK